MNTINTEEFFQNEYSGFAAYDLIRKIGHIADGLKNSSRKILHHCITQNVNSFQKVSNLASAIQQSTEYLHGSLEGTVVNVTQDFVGANNVPMLVGDGTFGTRFIQEAAASRYIFAKINPKFKQYFCEDDYNLLDHQEFEGTKIEPKYYVSTLPVLLLNGSTGVSVGYAQKVLPRKQQDLVDAIIAMSKGKPVKRITPFYAGFNGTIVQGDTPSQWLISGVIERQTKTQLVITEIPVGYDLQKYLAILEKLVETNKIKAYADESEDDHFRFIVAVTREVAEKTDQELLSLLKLTISVSENYTAMGVDNRVNTYENEVEMLQDWLTIRLEYNDKRRADMLVRLTEQKREADLRIQFIEAVISKQIVLDGKTKSEVLAQITAYNKEMDEFASMFMSMQLWSITKEKVNELNNKISALSNRIETLKEQSAQDILLKDLKELA
jgi:DNA topoisomerase-2